MRKIRVLLSAATLAVGFTGFLGGCAEDNEKQSGITAVQGSGGAGPMRDGDQKPKPPGDAYGKDYPGSSK